ncbi:MAG: Gfo/Idh/MocA family protein [Candidatus Eutrophobiaceae bacterium]
MATVTEKCKIRIALAGCGRISQCHFESFREHRDELELIAVCDNDPIVLEKHEKKLGVPGYLRLDGLLDRHAPDLVVLCTPSGLHAAQTMLAASKGCHVVTEKPMATRWSQGVKMVNHCDQAGVRLFIVKQNRFNPTLQLLKRALDDGRFGQLRMIHINVFWTRPQEYYDQAKWRGTWEFDGGALMNQASHYVDLLIWLFGPVEKIHAMTQTTRKIEVEDSGVLNIRWRNGCIGSMSVTMLTYPANMEGSVTVLGDNGSARIGGVAVNKIEHWSFADERDYDAQVSDSAYEPTSVYGFGHARYYQNVIDTLRGKAAAETDGREGLRSLELLIAAYLSARDGHVVSLPLEH